MTYCNRFIWSPTVALRLGFTQHTTETPCHRRIKALSSICSHVPAGLKQRGSCLHISQDSAASFILIQHCRKVHTCADRRDFFSSESQGTSADVAIEPRFAEALHLAWAASRGRSLFAARCLVSTALELHALGATAKDVHSYFVLTDLQSSDKLSDDARDVLTSWVALVSLTAEEAGYPIGHPEARRADAGGSSRSDRAGRQADSRTDDIRGGKGSLMAMNLGMRRFVKQVTAKFASGTRLADLIDIQEAGGDASPSVRLMQQNTRLVVITLELLEECGLPVRLITPGRPSAPSERADTTPSPSSSILRSAQGRQRQQQQRVRGFFASSAEPPPATVGSPWVDPAQYVAAFPDGDQPLPTVRAAAVKLLICYMGAMLGHEHSASAFVTEAVRCYRHGFTASALYRQLAYAEFKQQGGMIAVALTSSPHYTTVTAEVFSRWLSVVYMALAQLGVARPALDVSQGWAWAGEPTALQAQATADFVTATLRSGYASAGQALATVLDSPATERVLSEAAGLKLSSPPTAAAAAAGGFSTVKVEDPSLIHSSPSVLALAQQIDLVAFAVRAAQEGREGLLRRRPPSDRSSGKSDSHSSSQGAGSQQSRQNQAPSKDKRPKVPCPWPRRVNRRLP